MRHQASPRWLGLSLVELLVAVAITGILLAVAVPGLNAFLARQRLDGFVNELLSDLAQARLAGVGKQGSNANPRVQIARGAAKTCYVMYWGNNADDTLCRCDRPAGSACTGSRAWAELKVVNLPDSHGITLNSNKRNGMIQYLPELNRFSPVDYRLTITSSRVGELRLYVDGGSAVRVCSVGKKITGYAECAV